MKKLIAVILCVVLIISGCTQNNTQVNTNDNGKLNVVVTIFPQYDFVREIAGDSVNLRMLIPPGSESHTYDPSPGDIIEIQNSDLFIYAGGNGEQWVNTIINSFESKITSLALLDIITPLEQAHTEGMQITNMHNHLHLNDSNDEHNHEYDEHVWTSPVNADIICKKICDSLCELDPENAKIYTNNYISYSSKLKKLNDDILSMINGSHKNTIIFADRFPIRYFTEEYKLNYYAAFPGCASEVEPSPKTLIFLIDKIRQEKINVVFYREFSNKKVAQIICEETNAEMRLFHSCHNISADEFKSGATYLSIMQNNIANLKEALQ